MPATNKSDSMKRMYRFFGGLLSFCFLASVASAQEVLKPRPDAFAPIEELETKALQMASTVDEMASWDRYPTYGTYTAMMQRWAESYPSLCHIDTIGLSVQGRLILSMEISSALDDSTLPEFFYSSTMHGDEITGFVMMLRLIDTLLSSYGQNPRLTALMDSINICINPLANPDGTYHGGDNSVQNAWRYTSTYDTDLNRLYPDPFHNTSVDIPQENAAMIDYLSRHHFSLSANLHGGSEVLNYPWDSFRSSVRPHPQRDWWITVCERFMDTLRQHTASHFDDVNSNGYIAGGDWYVIGGGRQDYVNYYHNCLEMTMEISTSKKLNSDLLPTYWNFLAPSLIGYIGETLNLDTNVGISTIQHSANNLRLYPNPATDRITVEGLPKDSPLDIYDMQGRRVRHMDVCSERISLDLNTLPSGLYLLSAGDSKKIIVKL